MRIKRIAVLVLLTSFCFTGFGQQYALDKGAVLVRGHANFNSGLGDHYDSDRFTSFTLSANCFVMEKLYIGFGSEWLAMDYESMGLGPQVGYVIGEPIGAAFLYLEGGYKYHAFNKLITYSDMYVGAGVLVPLASHIGFSLDASIHKSFTDLSNSIDYFALGLGLIVLIH